ncbi:MAG: moderate conductance mechanosensitive channel [Actinomycetota bacterium]|nr:moderate conductance mechanosensitive channel [Actinomycetota bacterium]
MDCQPDDWVCHALAKVGLDGFAAETVQWLLQGPLKIALVLLGAVLGARWGGRLVRRTVAGLSGRNPLREPTERSEKRATTLAGVAASSLKVVIWSFTVLIVAEELGFNLGPLLAGASIVGVALGFGAQSLVKDFISGFFIIVEDQYGVGDQITISTVSGAVEQVNLRVTTIRAQDGTVWIIPNGEIRMVGNAAKDWARAVVDVLVPNGADIAKAIAVITEVVEGLAHDPDWADVLLEKPEVLGVDSLGTAGATVRVEAKTAPSNRVRLGRELRSRIGGKLQQEGIVTRQDLTVEPPPPAPEA